MDVGDEITMQKILVIATLGAVASCATAGQHAVFGANIGVSESCVITVAAEDKLVEYKPDFEMSGKCRLVTHPEANIPSTYFIDGKYIFFVESNARSGGECSSEYTAIGVSKSGDLFTTDRIKSSRSCFQGRELHDYEYFAAKLTPHMPIARPDI